MFRVIRSEQSVAILEKKIRFWQFLKQPQKDHAAHEAFDKLMAKFGDFHRLMRRHPDASKVEDDGTFSFIFRPHTVRNPVL